MATLQDRDKRSFVPSPTRGVEQYSREVTIAGSGNLLNGIEFDEIAVTYPTTSSEVYTYKLATVTQAIITITYTDSCKENITSVVKS